MRKICHTTLLYITCLLVVTLNRFIYFLMRYYLMMNAIVSEIKVAEKELANK